MLAVVGRLPLSLLPPGGVTTMKKRSRSLPASFQPGRGVLRAGTKGVGLERKGKERGVVAGTKSHGMPTLRRHFLEDRERERDVSKSDVLPSAARRHLKAQRSSAGRRSPLGLSMKEGRAWLPSHRNHPLTGWSARNLMRAFFLKSGIFSG